MDNILEPNEQFDFSLLSLGQPSSIQGGAYFTKIQYKENPFYIETPKSLTRQGFVKNGKKMVVDLMFDNTNEEFIHWMENLETKCQELIHQKGESWFQNKLEMNDIESAFNSPMKIYKSGKFYLVRVNVKMNYGTNNPYIKIYNENEIPLTIDDVNAETNVISILEIQGIKFTTRSFQIEMEVKQMMVLNTYEIFETCVIKHKSITEKKNSNDADTVEADTLEADTLEADMDKEDKINDTLDETPLIGEQKNNTEKDVEISILSIDHSSESPTLNIDSSKKVFDENLNKENSSLEKMNENELTEVHLEDIENLESIQLKKPNQVYYEIYKEARRKAKEAKKNAMIAFLEAKNIKKTYMLEDLDDSDDEEEDYENDDDEEDEEDDYEK